MPRSIKNRRPIRGLAWVLACCAVSLPASWASVADFSRYPTYDQVTVSPKGSYLAISHRKDTHDILSILRLPNLEVVYSRAFGANLSISNILWATDERLLIQPARRFPAQLDYEVPTGEIAAIDADGGEPELLFGYQAGLTDLGIHTRKRKPTREAGQVIDLLPDDPRHVIIQTLGFGVAGKRNEALRLNIHDGSTRSLARSPINNGRFVTDADHEVRLVAGSNEAGDYEGYYREDADGQFVLRYSGSLTGGTLEPILRTPRAGYYLFADTVSQPTRGLVEWNPVGDGRREIFRHPVVDYSTISVDAKGGLWAVRFVDHFPDYHYPDPEHPYVTLHRRLRAAFPDDDVRIVSQTDDARLLVAHASGPQNPGAFLLVDGERRALLQRLDSRPWLTGRALAAMQPLEVTVRDGLKVRSYLTLPVSGGSDLPLVVLVHGGPHGVADTWGFNPEVQLLAEQGYAVLQVNFRGSGGRGRDFQAAGFGRWGAEMQDDITDSVRYLVDEGVADPARIAIYGGSYGAYAALTGAYRDPDLYRCAIGYAGIYDLPLMFEKGDVQSVQSGENFLEAVIGTDQPTLRARSPVFNAGAIRAKVMLIHGKLDQRAPYAHARRMRAALIEAGNPPRWLVESKEGHGFGDEANRLEMYSELLEFLDSCLKETPE